MDGPRRAAGAVGTLGHLGLATSTEIIPSAHVVLDERRAVVWHVQRGACDFEDGRRGSSREERLAREMTRVNAMVREAKLVNWLRHPNVARYFGVVEQFNGSWQVWERMDRRLDQLVGWLFALPIANVGTRRAHSELN